MGALCQYVAGINARGNAVDADAGRARPFLQGPKGRDWAAMAWQQRGMDIHPTTRRQSQCFQRENLIEMKGKDHIGPCRPQRRVAGRAVHILNLKQRNAVRARAIRKAMLPAQTRNQGRQCEIDEKIRQEARAGTAEMPQESPKSATRRSAIGF